MENDDVLLERYSLVVERISQIPAETTVQEPLRDYFVKMAEFIMQMDELKRKLESGETQGYTLEQWQEQNAALYADILPENYETSYANPAWAVKTLGDVYGRILSFLYAELRGMIVYAFEGRLTEMTILNELFVEIYNCFEDELPSYRKLQQIVYWFESDNSDITVEYRTREAIDPSLDFAVRIICEEDLNDLRYLYKYGEYVSENELEMARFMNSLPQEDIDLMADTYTEGYRIGFVLGHKDLSKKETVNIRFTLGFERMVKKAIQNFAQMGLKPVIYRAAVSSVNKRQASRIGYLGGIPNKQFDYDHKNDNAIYLDKPFIERKLGVMRTAYENYRKLANGHAGPACIETFGEQPFAPLDKEEAYHLSDKQQKLSALYDSESAQLTNQYIIGEERSFTIIAFPVPEIGSSFEEIFREVVRINTLDYKLYERIQQTIIDVLDTGVSVHIRGCGRNRTDLTVMLKDIEDPQKQTKFENCVADVNIPVGEVFTSPKLSGTTGVLHVSEVYLNELKYIDLSVTLKDGMITDYTCGNFDSEEKNRKYVRENVLYHHDTLPLGEFAIGTNTTAYAAARKYGIADKLPILIAEKMGPHFAVGDTCYSWSEDTAVFNPNGKEIVARDNEVPGRAYFNCHTDITIPYDELGLIEVVREDGSRTEIIKDGRFVLPGTEELNKPL